MSDTKVSIESKVQTFAEDIVTCVMQRHHQDWAPTKTYQKGDTIIQYEEAILYFCDENELPLSNEWWQYFNGKEKSIHNYEKFCTVVESIVSNMEFSVGKLLAYLLKLSEFAAHLYDSGCFDAPSSAMKSISQILLKFPDFFQAPSADPSSLELHL